MKVFERQVDEVGIKRNEEYRKYNSLLFELAEKLWRCALSGTVCEMEDCFLFLSPLSPGEIGRVRSFVCLIGRRRSRRCRIRAQRKGKAGKKGGGDPRIMCELRGNAKKKKMERHVHSSKQSSLGPL